MEWAEDREPSIASGDELWGCWERRPISPAVYPAGRPILTKQAGALVLQICWWVVEGCSLVLSSIINISWIPENKGNHIPLWSSELTVAIVLVGIWIQRWSKHFGGLCNSWVWPLCFARSSLDILTEAFTLQCRPWGDCWTFHSAKAVTWSGGEGRCATY